jgi:hypothetical protein
MPFDEGAYEEKLQEMIRTSRYQKPVQEQVVVDLEKSFRQGVHDEKSFTTLGCPNRTLSRSARAREYGYDGIDFRGYLDTGYHHAPSSPAGAATLHTLEDAGLEVSGIARHHRLRAREGQFGRSSPKHCGGSWISLQKRASSAAEIWRRRRESWRPSARHRRENSRSGWR